MVKKVIDVISLENKKASPSRGNMVVEAVPQNIKPKPPKFWRRLLIIFSILLFCGAAVAGISIFKSKLNLSLFLKQENTEIIQDLKVDGLAQTSDFDRKVVQGKVFNAQKSLEINQKATGQDEKGSKARGVIRVFNKRNPPAAKALVAQTRFLSSDGKTFKALKKIELPAATLENGKLTPGFLDVEVEAQETGEQYNIGPSTFSVPGLVGSALYYDLWGESTAKMEGGSLKTVQKVTVEDLENAKATLEAQLEEELKKDLRSQAGQDFWIEDKAVLIDNPEIICEKKEGDIVGEFKCQGKSGAKSLAIKTSALKDFAYHILSNQIPPTTNFRMETVSLSLTPENVDFASNLMDIEVKIGSKVYQNIDKDKLIAEVVGKSQDDIEQMILQRYQQVEKIDFAFWPFWVKRCPTNSQRVNIGFQFSD
ncbi:MAG: hypothetical protein PHN39_01340 [Candidatus Pacebacteria bacterium]|nr:hypothetical protein [Candidatus Paceibacterota bacterium]